LLAVGLSGTNALAVAHAEPTHSGDSRGPALAPKMIGMLSIHDMSMLPNSPHARFVDGLESTGLANGTDYVVVPRHVNWVKGSLKGSASNLDNNPAIDAVVTMDSLSNTVITESPSAITKKNVMVAICGDPGEFSSAPSTIIVTGFTNNSIGKATERLSYLPCIYTGSGPIGILYDAADPSAQQQMNNVKAALGISGVPCPVGLSGDIKSFITYYIVFGGVKAFFVTLDPRLVAARADVVGVINSYKIPAIYGDADFVTGTNNGGPPLGGLLAYGVDRRLLAYRAGVALIPWVGGGPFPTGWTYPDSADFELYTSDATAMAQLGTILPATIGGKTVHHV
jgi:ABC-type uncharacterized transport system substrate-binding protein